MKSLSPLLLILICCELSLLTLSPEASAEIDPVVSFQQGNAAYNEGNYKQAIKIFEEIIGNHGFSASVLYNLGNSYAQNNEIGRAILSYERARILKPGDPDITGNLQYLYKVHGIFEVEPSRVERYFSRLGYDDWAGLATLSLILLCLSLVVITLRQRTRKAPFVLISLFSLILFMVSSWAIFTSYQSWQVSIVIEPKTRVYLSPFLSAASIGTIQEGRQVLVGKSHDDFFYVTDETGRSGWLSESAIESILP